MPEKYAPGIIKALTGVFALKDSNDENYLSGPKLVDLFNKLGFKDAYNFPGGIQIADGNMERSLSRTQYAFKRLSDLNEKFQAPRAVQELQKAVGNITKVQEQLSEIVTRQPAIHRPTDGIGAQQVIKLDSPNDKWKILLPELKRENDRKEDNGVSDEEFDNIPTGVKVAFISYSWDTDAHKEWVLKLSNALTKRGIHVLLDQYLKPGYPLTRFMDRGIDIADRVIVVGSPQYLIKSMTLSSGGVPYEDNIISSALMANIATTKFLPVIHEGKFDECLPQKLSKRLGFDFSNEDEFDKKVDELARAIHDVPLRPRPTLGSVPNYTYADLTDREIEGLKSPNSDFRKKQDRKWLERLLGYFSFDLMESYLRDYPTSIDSRIINSYDMWSSILSQSTFRIYDSKLGSIIQDFYRLWNEVVKIGERYYSPIAGMPNRFKFMGLQNDSFISKEANDDFDKIIGLQLQMQPKLKEMARYIMDNFEIDVEDTSQRFIDSLSQ